MQTSDSIGEAEDASAGAHPLERLERWCARVAQPIAFLGVIGMLIVSGATVVDVLLRWTANAGVAALNEVVSMTFVVAITACLPAGLSRGASLVVDVLERWLVPRLAAWLAVLGAVLLLVFFGLLTWRIAAYAASLDALGRATVALLWPQAPFFYGAAILLGAATAVQAVVAANRIRAAAAVRHKRAEVGTTIWIVSGLYVAFLIALGGVALWGVLDFAGLSATVQSDMALTIGIAFVLMWFGLLGLVPLTAVMGLMGIVGTALVLGFGPAFGAFATEVSDFLANYHVATLPLFLMMGSFAVVAGLSDDVYRLANALLGPFRGGLAMATILGCAGFGSVTGSSFATVATFGRVALPQMRERGYAPELATGCVAAGGTLGALIPPSGMLIVFALLTEASIGQLFIAAIVPGLIATALYIATILAVVRLRPSCVPPPSRAASIEIVAALRQCGPVVLLFGAVLGGIYAGVFTATEAAAVGAFGSFLVAALRGKLRGNAFWTVMAETTMSTAMIYGLIFGVTIFSFFIGISGLPEQMTAYIAQLDLPPLAVVALLLLGFLALGCVMDSFAVMVITVPIVTPLILHFGYDLVWWGIINLVIIEIGMITPPFGLNLFVLKSLSTDVPLTTVFRGALPFCTADLIKLLLLLLLPALTLWLPSTMVN